MKKILNLAWIAVIAAASCQQKETNKYSTFDVNGTTSKAEWKGSARDHFHVGSFNIKGSLQASDNGSVNGGDFIIPIASIQDFDLKDPIKQALLNDLKSANFFNLVVHPEATFHITKAEAYSTKDTAAVEGANYLLTGNFTMVGQTHTISFPAKIVNSKNNLSAEAKFNIDRTKWGMNIYSDSTKPLYILPEVNIHLQLQASPRELAKL